MGCVMTIPERDFGWIVGKELTPVSADVFISIPERDCVGTLYKLPIKPGYQYPVGSDIFNWLNNSVT